MRTNRLVGLLTSVIVSSALLAPALLRAQAAGTASVRELSQSAPWLGHEAEIEDYLRTVEIQSTTGTGEGVTHPLKAKLPPGGPVEYLAFKNIPRGPQNGAMESYQSEIAAYELDKMLHLGMIPPTVEKVYKKTKGAAVYWIPGTKNFNELGAKNGGAPTAPPAKSEYWNVQIIRAKMFDCLAGNQDPNLGNWLADADWNLYIIDHSRALYSDTTFPHKLNHIDSELWDRMKLLTLPDLTAKLGPWMDKGDIKTIITRRDIMAKQIADLVKKAGGDESKVFVKYPS